MKTRSTARMAMLCAFVLGLAGCGGTSTPSASATSAPSLSAFRSGFAADKVQFRKLSRDLQHAIAGAQSETDAQLATEFAALSERTRNQASQLSQLKPPPKDAAQLSQLVSGFDATARDLKQISIAAAKHDVQAARAATKLLLQHAAVVKAADDRLTASLGLPRQA